MTELTPDSFHITNGTFCVSEAQEGVDFEDRLANALWNQSVEVGICGWVPSDEELQGVKVSGVEVYAVGGASIVSE